MKVTAFALLISGLFSSAMLPLASATADDGFPNHGQGQWSAYQPTVLPSHSYPQQWDRAKYDSARPGGFGYGQQSPYHFRPWSGEAGRKGAPQAYSNGRQPETPASHTWRGQRTAPQMPQFTGQAPHGYRFRPVQNQSQPSSVPPAGLTYRPANVEIPNHYVYRPLNPVRKARPRVYNRPQQPVMPRPPVYTYTPYHPMGYGPATVNQPRPVSPPQPRGRYVYGYNQYPGAARFRPVAPGYGARPPWVTQMPRYAANPRMDRPRFRPSQQFDRPQYRRQFRTGSEAYYRAPPVAGYPSRAYTWRAPAWERPRLAYPQPYSAIGHPYNRAPGYSRYGVDWYDGRSDGEGAWYKLAEQQEWPRVSQNWPGE